MMTSSDSEVSRSGRWRIRDVNGSDSSESEGEARAPPPPEAPTRRNPRRKARGGGAKMRLSSDASVTSFDVDGDESVERVRRGGKAPAAKGGRRRNPRGKKAVVAAIEQRSDGEGEEEGNRDADGDDPVEQMRAMTRLPAVLTEVRKYGAEIIAVCDQLEQILIDDGGEKEMDSLKRKLCSLSERCHTKIQAELKVQKKVPKARRSRRDEFVENSPVKAPRRVIRSNSVDYTEYASPDRSAPEVTADPEDLPDESAKDSGNPSSGQDESPVAPVQPEAEPIRDAPMEDTFETGIMDITDPSDAVDGNLLFDSEMMADLCPPPTESMLNESSIINDDIFCGLRNDHDYYATPAHREIVPPTASPKRPQNPQCSDTPTSSFADSSRRRVQQSLDKYFPVATTTEKVVSPLRNAENDDDGEVQFVSATVGRRQRGCDVQIKPEPEVTAAETKTVAIYEPEAGPSKAPVDQWMIRKVDVKKPQFVTSNDPSPNREPTIEEVRYVVPHQPKFTVQHVAQGENPDLEQMKREIEMRLRIPELSWITQRAIREESGRVKKVKQNNEKLQQQLSRYQTSIPANQLILDHDDESNTFIRVHPELVRMMKPHQREGVKFLYDCCYGGIKDVKNANGSGCILAHCMGLGKTLQVIALMNTVICYPKLKTRRIIVICPKSTVMNWAQEIKHWLGDIQSGVSLKVFFLPDSSNIYKKLEVLRGFHSVSGKTASVLLIGYEAFRSLVFYDASNRKGEKHSEGVRTEVRRVLINPGADLIILDEGHIIKNRKSQTNLSVAEVATKRRIILTGTPIQNNLNEYYCMVNFVKPAYLGSEKEFNAQYATPIRNGQHKDSDIHDIRFMKMQSFILHKNLLNFVQRKEFEVLKDFLPRKFEYVLYVPLTPVQEDLYEQYLKRNPLDQEQGGIHLLEDYTFLRKIWTHPIVLERAWETAMKKRYGVQERKRVTRRAHGFDSSSDDDEDNDADRARSITNVWWKQIISADDLESLFPSNKMILLFEILQMCKERGEKCLIFSGFVMVLNMVEHFMKMIDEQDRNPKAQLYGLNKFRGPWRPGMDFYRIDGGTSKSTRHEMVTKFNDPNNRVTRVFLISTKAGGQGINLVGANRVIILDTSWNPAVDQQGIFRIYRLGQQKTCYVYRLLAMHTMEEKVYSRAVTKQAMSHRVADKKQVDRNYSMADLEALYHFERVDMGARPNAAPAEDELLSKLLYCHHKLIYRYHTHEMMLDNKNEKDLTEAEKVVAWHQFKTKGLSMNASLGLGVAAGMGALGRMDSQMSDPDVDSQLMDEFDHACKPEDVKPDVGELPPAPLAIPMERSFGSVSNRSTVFGEDPYNDHGYGGRMSIIEEQKQRMSLKPEPELKQSHPPSASQVSVSAAEVELLRDLEESAAPEDEEPPRKKIALNNVPVLETIDLLNLSYEGDSEEIHDASFETLPSEVPISIPSSVAVSACTSFSSVIEYDPVESTEQSSSSTYNGTTVSTVDQSVSPLSVVPPPSYEKFKASLVEDPYVATSTTTAVLPPAVVASSSSPALTRASRRVTTRSMKRPAPAPLAPVLQAKKICHGIGAGSPNSSYQSNQCRALVPFTGHRRVVAINPILKDWLTEAGNTVICVASENVNPCRALVPYVVRVSLLEDILAEAAETASISDQFSTESDDDDDGSDTDSTSSSYPQGLLTQASTMSWTAADLAAMDENFSETYHTALSEVDEGDGMDFTQHTLTDSQQTAARMAKAQMELADLMASLHETRQVVAGDMLSDCLAVVRYNPPVSLWNPEMVVERITESEPKTFVLHTELQRGLKRKLEKDLPEPDSTVWKKPRTAKVYKCVQRPVELIPNEEPIEAKLLSQNTTLSWGDEEVDFTEWNLSCGEIEDPPPLCPPVVVPHDQPSPSEIKRRKYALLSPFRAPSRVAIYCPIRSFWDPKLLTTPNALLPVINERKGQILRGQHNKLFRFVPYDKTERKWRKVPAPIEEAAIERENTCRSLLVYSGSGSKLPAKSSIFVLHPYLAGYLSFCRYVTQQSTERDDLKTGVRSGGMKRKLTRESMSGQPKRS